MSDGASLSPAGLVLGSGRRRLRVVPTLLALVVYAVFALLQHGEVLAGLIEPQASHLLSAFNLAGALVFYGLVRSGRSERWSDPALTAPQMAWGLVATAGSYAITGAARGAVLSLLVLILVFGMFALPPQRARALALFGFVLISGVMLVRSHATPEQYPPVVETVHFLFAVIVLSGVSALSMRMGALRARLKAQKQELEAALAQIRLLATQDELTGLFNRRHMTGVLASAAEQAGEDGRPLCLVLIDLDHFKRINDTHGHQAGDMVLRRFAEAGRSVVRGGDVLARWGGEEFLLMLPATTPAQALQVVARLRMRLVELDFDDVAPGLKVTFSAGLCTHRMELSLEAVLDLADQAMYRAKTGGRDRTVTA